MKKKKVKLTYVGGNWLRGFIEGEFNSIDEAWSYLSKRFLVALPSKTGRSMYMYVVKKNEFGFMQPTLCKEGTTEINKITERGAKIKCRASNYRLL